MAGMLGVTPVQVRRMELGPDKSIHRPVTGTTERLIRAYLDGYRPADWPLTRPRAASGDPPGD